MNCHGDHNEKKNSHKHSSIRHMLHMVLCCGLPIVIIALLPFIAKVSPGVAGKLSVIAPFICPIMMGLMMFSMFGGKKKSCCGDSNENNSKAIEFKKTLE